MNIEKEINQATELADKIGEALDGESMALVLTVLSRMYIQSAIEMDISKEDLMSASSHIYDLLADNSDEAIH
jgi:hypothetical protein